MEQQINLPPITPKPTQNLPPPPIHPSPPPHSTISAAVQHRETQLLLIDNLRLAALHASLSDDLSTARQDLRQLSDVAVKVKAERDAEVREVYGMAVKMEAEVKLIEEACCEVIQSVVELQKLKSETKELDEKLKKVCEELVKVEDELNQVSVMKSEIEMMQREIQRGRTVIEHEKRVNASNSKQRRLMEKYKMLMAVEIKKLQVEVADARKKARAAAAAEGVSVPGNQKFGG